MTKRSQETRSIQLWPGGQGLILLGDPHDTKWRVTSWLCEQLHRIGEVTISNGYGHWWGRTCTGQGLIMDGTLQEIAASFD